MQLIESGLIYYASENTKIGEMQVWNETIVWIMVTQPTLQLIFV